MSIAVADYHMKSQMDVITSEPDRKQNWTPSKTNKEIVILMRDIVDQMVPVTINNSHSNMVLLTHHFVGMRISFYLVILRKFESNLL